MNPQRFRKKPIIVEAMQFDGSPESIVALYRWSGDVIGWSQPGGQVQDAFVVTMEGEMAFDTGCWIVKGVQGEFYPIKSDIFAETYEPEEQGA